MFSNDEILHRLSGLNVTKKDRDSSNVTVDDMNSYIAESLAGVMFPVNMLTPKRQVKEVTQRHVFKRSVSACKQNELPYNNIMTK